MALGPWWKSPAAGRGEWLSPPGFCPLISPKSPRSKSLKMRRSSDRSSCVLAGRRQSRVAGTGSHAGPAWRVEGAREPPRDPGPPGRPEGRLRQSAGNPAAPGSATRPGAASENHRGAQRGGRTRSVPPDREDPATSWGLRDKRERTRWVQKSPPESDPTPQTRDIASRGMKVTIATTNLKPNPISN